MDELKRLNKILNIELAVIIIFIVVMGAGVFLVFQQLTLRLDAIVTQTESAEAVLALKDIISWQSEYEVEFRTMGKEKYAQNFWAIGEEFDSMWKEARANIILFDPEASFFYKSNNLRDYHIEFNAVVSEIFSHTREGTLEEAKDLIEQHETLEEKMVEITNEWQELNRKNLISLRSDATRFTNTVFGIGLVFVLLISASFITISRRFFSPFIKNLVSDLTDRTKELERTKKDLEKSKTVLEIKIKARTKELQNLTQNLEEQVKKRTKALESTNNELVKKSIDLTEFKGQLEDKNFELESAINNLHEQNKDLVKKTMALTELQSQLDDKNYELEQANEEILELMKARTEFISRAAHDLRTPITPIMLLIPTIKKRIKDKGILYDLSVMERNANYLRLIANNLISYLKSQTGKYTYIFKKMNVEKIIDDVIKVYGEAFKQHKISVKKNIAGKLPLVEMDELKITEVIQNIFSNALKFMPKGGRLTISAKKIDNIINIRFEDTGIGITKSDLPKIFGEFFKADVSRHVEGEGLGLSICKEIIEDHHGRILAESEGRGKGSAILFEIPIKQKAG